MFNLNFNANEVAPQAAMEPVPSDWYNTIITDSEIKPTNAGDGTRLIFTLKIVDGQFVNRQIWCGLNIDNPNPKAVEIAQGQLSAICHATGIMQVNTQTLPGMYNIPFQTRAQYVPEKDGYQAKNECRGFRPVENGGAPAQQPVQQPAQQPVQQPAEVTTQPISAQAMEQHTAPAQATTSPTPPWKQG